MKKVSTKLRGQGNYLLLWKILHTMKNILLLIILSGIQLFAAVSNEGIIDRTALFSLNLDGTLFDSRRITVPANSSANLTWDLPVGTATISAQLTENEDDLLTLDNTAWAVHEGGVTNRTLLVTEAGLYNIVNRENSSSHVMEINVTGEGFQIFTFTFG